MELSTIQIMIIGIIGSTVLPSYCAWIISKYLLFKQTIMTIIEPLMQVGTTSHFEDIYNPYSIILVKEFKELNETYEPRNERHYKYGFYSYIHKKLIKYNHSPFKDHIVLNDLVPWTAMDNLSTSGQTILFNAANDTKIQLNSLLKEYSKKVYDYTTAFDNNHYFEQRWGYIVMQLTNKRKFRFYLYLIPPCISKYIIKNPALGMLLLNCLIDACLIILAIILFL